MSHKKILSIIILLCAGIAYGQDDPNALSAKIAQLEKTIARQERIIEKQKTKLEEQEKEIKRLFALCRQNGIEPNSKKIARNTKEVIEAESIDGREIKAGQIFVMGKYGYFKITQIIDKQNAIAELWWKMTKPLEKDVPLSAYGCLDNVVTVWIKGFSTENMVDGNTLKSDKVLKVTGTKMYTNVLGASKTIFLIEPYKPSQDSNEPNQ